jgi:methyl-accepting chemotaxis protein
VQLQLQECVGLKPNASKKFNIGKKISNGRKLNLNISKKLYGSFGIIVLLLILTSIITLISLSKVNSSYEDLFQRQALLLLEMKNIQMQSIQQNSSMRDYLLVRSEAAKQMTIAANGDVATALKKAITMAKRAEVKKQLEALVKLNEDYMNKSNEVFKMVSQQDASNMASADLFPLARVISDIADLLAVEQQQLMDKGAAHNNKLVDQVNLLLLVISIISVVLAAGLGYWMARHLSKPLIQLMQYSKRIAGGDLRKTSLNIRNRDEIGELAQSFEGMRTQLHDLIQQVQSSVEQVAASSQQLTASSEQTSEAANHIAGTIESVSSGAEMQTKSTEETVISMQEIAVGIQRIAESASNVSEIAGTTLSQVTQGQGFMEKTIEQMNGIYKTVQVSAEQVDQLGRQAAEIGQIARLITDISEQTNLLALNASIEAARAGEHGKGFAVVAGEVKKLASMTQESAGKVSSLIRQIQSSTSEIVQTIRTSLKEVTDGRQLLMQTGETLTFVYGSMQDTSDQIQEVSAASQQVSAGSEEILATIEEIARVAVSNLEKAQQVAAATEEQLATMEETASSAAALTVLAEELQDRTGKFTVE